MMYVKYCFNPSIKSSIMALCNVPVLTYPIVCRTSRFKKKSWPGCLFMDKDMEHTNCRLSNSFKKRQH